MQKQISFQVRPANREDWQPAMDLAWNTCMRFEADYYSQEGIQNFQDFVTDNALFRMFLEGRYPMFVALAEEEILGMISLRNGNHISLLFVDESYHRRGVGRAILTALCNYLKLEAGERYMSLKASPYAVNFYRRLGFRVVKPEEEYCRIRVTAMEKIF